MLYLVLGFNLHGFVNCLKRTESKLKRKSTKHSFSVLLVAFNIDVEHNEKAGFDVGMDLVQEPYVLDLGMKFVLLASSDLFYTVCMMAVISLFSLMDWAGPMLTTEALNRFNSFSAIDFGFDLLFLVVVMLVWRKAKGSFRKLELFKLASKFFRRYYMVFLIANFALFLSLFIIMASDVEKVKENLSNERLI